MHHPMIKQTVPESLDCQEKVDATTRIVGITYVLQSTNNLYNVSIIMGKGCMETIWPYRWKGLSGQKYLPSDTNFHISKKT